MTSERRHQSVRGRAADQAAKPPTRLYSWGRHDGEALLRGLNIPELDSILRGAGHVDVKGANSDLPLRQFVAQTLGWQPAWMKTLYQLRPYLARALRLRSPDVPGHRAIAPEDVPFEPGGKIWFFTVVTGVEDHYLILETADRHLTATLVMIADQATRRRLLAATVVNYHHWSGPIYFNLIRPLHHLVVRSVVKAGLSPGHS